MHIDDVHICVYPMCMDVHKGAKKKRLHVILDFELEENLNYLKEVGLNPSSAVRRGVALLVAEFRQKSRQVPRDEEGGYRVVED